MGDFWISVKTPGNFDSYDEKYYVLENLTKDKVNTIVDIINSTMKIKKVDEQKEIPHQFPNVTYDEVWTIAKKFSAGCRVSYIANYIETKREEEYKTIFRKYSIDKIKFPKSRVQEIIDLIDKRKG